MKKGDKIVGIILFIVVVISLSATSIYKFIIKGTENIAVIKSQGKVLRTIDLNNVLETEELTIKTDKGEFNLILVNPNEISIEDANCPHKECVKIGVISEPGEVIVCLPNKVVISIEGQGNKEIDGGTY